MNGSTPSITDFDPTIIPFQMDVIRDVRKRYDYSNGIHEILLSGSVGSAKSILAAHLGLTHCLMYPKARLVLCRQSMPDLKDTILAKCLEHLAETNGIEEGKHWEHNITKASIHFANGSDVISRSWRDKKFKKFRSIEASAAIVEELTENDDQYKEFYPELKMRVGRLPNVKESWIISCTNPDAPSHWAWKYFIGEPSPTRHVYYSLTEQNPFLPKSYIEQLKRDLDPKLARRMLKGEWIEIASDVIYYAYSRDRNYLDAVYVPNLRYPINISFDFNIGLGKPMSAVCAQQIDGHFHFFGEAVIHSANTEEILNEYAGRGLFELPCKFIINGDATGKNRDTRSNKSDYDIIRQFLQRYTRKDGSRPIFEIRVPLRNPPVRTRHNRVNAYCLNSDGKSRLTVYKDAATLDEGFRLTALKSGGDYIEDDSKSFQHITTAAGYCIMEQTTQVEQIAEFNRWGQWKF